MSQDVVRVTQCSTVDCDGMTGSILLTAYLMKLVFNKVFVFEKFMADVFIDKVAKDINQESGYVFFLHCIWSVSVCCASYTVNRNIL